MARRTLRRSNRRRLPASPGWALLLALAASCEGPAESEEPSAPEPAPLEVSETPMEFGQVRIGEIDWYVDYAVALGAARTRDLPLWVHFGEHPG